MAELLAYSIVNGSAVNYNFYKEVETQADIDSIRNKLYTTHNLDGLNNDIIANNKLMGIKDELYQILFTLRQPQGSKLMP